jgi:antitoxin (DNA-binding transcriptional repressor) of toxin-antitoxin stability system
MPEQTTTPQCNRSAQTSTHLKRTNKHRESRMIKDMPQVHITAAELARGIHAVLEKVRQGEEVIIEEGYRRVAVIKPVEGPGRSIDECIALARAYEERLGYAPLPDPDFAKDVQSAIDAHLGPFDPPSWD